MLNHGQVWVLGSYMNLDMYDMIFTNYFFVQGPESQSCYEEETLKESS